MRVLGSRIGWAFVVGHWALWAAAVWERNGGLWWPFHAYYEPWLLLGLLLVDVIWVIVPGVFLSVNDAGWLFLTTALIGSVQWYWVGYMLEKRRLR